MSGVRIPVYNSADEVVEEAVVDKSLVPHIIHLTLRAGAEYPDIRYFLGAREWVQPLHERAYDLSPAATARPRRPGYEVHHKNGNKFDARGSNLELRDAKDHKRLTLKKRQKVTYRARLDLSRGWWREHSPAPAKNAFYDCSRDMLDDEIASRREALAKRPWHDGLSAEEIAAEPVLAAALAAHRERLGGREDRTSKIPPMKPGRWPRQMRGEAGREIRRLGTWPGEVSVVMCFVEHGGDRSAMSACLGQSVHLIDRILARPAVRWALEVWARHRRWPKPCPPDGWRQRRRRHA